MNALQLLPLGAKTAPPVSTGGKAPVGEALSAAKKPPAAAPPNIGPSNNPAPAAGPAAKSVAPQAAEQLAQARANTIKAADERKVQAERAAQAAKEAAQAKKEAAELSDGPLEREVGLVEGTTKVFVDLVDPALKKSVFRVFGPEDAPQQTEAAPKGPGVTNPYTRNSAPTPLKDVGIA
jgi:hypothetical protein